MLNHAKVVLYIDESEVKVGTDIIIEWNDSSYDEWDEEGDDNSFMCNSDEGVISSIIDNEIVIKYEIGRNEYYNSLDSLISTNHVKKIHIGFHHSNAREM